MFSSWSLPPPYSLFAFQATALVFLLPHRLFLLSLPCRSLFCWRNPGLSPAPLSFLHSILWRPHSVSWQLYAVNSQISISRTDCQLKLQIIYSIAYSAPPLECLIYISKWASLNLNFWYLTPSLLLLWCCSLDSWLENSTVPGAWPKILWLFLHLLHQQILLVLLTKYIQNAAASYYLCCHHPGASYHLLLPGSLQKFPTDLSTSTLASLQSLCNTAVTVILYNVC